MHKPTVTKPTRAEFLSRANSRFALKGLLSLLAAILASSLGIKTFEAWSQVVDLWDSGVHPFFLIGHPHIFRYLATYPGLVLESYFPNQGFSLFVCIFFAYNVVLWHKLSLLASRHEPGLGSWFIFLAAHFAMNGRGVIAWTAWLICACTCLQIAKNEIHGVRKIFSMASACFLAGVSSGVFMVTASALAYFQWTSRTVASKKKGRRFKYALLLISVPIVLVVLDYFYAALTKNLDFYGGGISGLIGMLQHGLGAFLLGKSTAVLVGLVAITPLIATATFILIVGRPLLPIQKLIAFALVGGLFGLTVLTLVLPVILICTNSRIGPKNQANKSSNALTTGNLPMKQPSGQGALIS